jgi:type I restriction enzyme S subunit
MTWKNGTLSDLVFFQRGFDITKAQQQDGRVPVISSSGVQSYHSEAKVTGPGVIIGRKGTLGSVHYSDTDYWPHDTTLWSKDFRGNDTKFVYYFLKTLNLQKFDTGNSNPTLNRNHIHLINIRFPDVETQQRIASELAIYDSLIANNISRIELLERSARMLFEEWFVRFRYPGHEHDKIVDGVPEGWERSTIDGICTEFIDGDWLESKDQGGDSFRILQISNIGENAFVETGNYRFITEETFKRLRCTEVRPGDIIISRMPEPIGRAWLVTKKPWRMVTAVDVTIARSDNSKVDLYYFLHHLNSRPHIARCKAGATGATRPRTAKRVMAALPILLPPHRLQKEFSSFASVVNKMKERLVKQNDGLAEARDLILPRLMDGRIEV